MTQFDQAYLPLFFLGFILLSIFGGGLTKKDTAPSKLRWLKPTFLTIAVVLILLGGAYATYVSTAQQKEPSKEPQKEPPEINQELPPPIKDPAEVYSQGPGSLLRSFALNHYDLKDTSAEDEEDLRKELFDLLEQNKQQHIRFDLPEGFVIRETTPLSDFTTAGSIQEYDMQILDAWQNVTESNCGDRAFQYHRVNIAALNCLDILSRQCERDRHLYKEMWDDFIYYGELAVWALTNEYIYGNLITAEKVDLFYRLSQVYDHTGTAATDDDPPFQHELYFISAAFLELSFRSLQNIEFADMGQEYRSAVWDLYMTMHFRMGTYVKNNDGFFKKVIECSDKVTALDNLTEAERNKVQKHLDEIDEWKLFH